MARWARSIAIGLTVALVGLLTTLSPLGTAFERTVGLDLLFKVRGALAPPPEVAVVGINSRTGRSLDLPRLPRDWPRAIYADLIRRLVELNAEVIVFDFDFSRAKPDDETFAAAIAQSKRVVLFEWLAGRRERIANADGSDGGWTWIEEKQPPAELLAKAATARGPFPLPKLDQAVFEFWNFKSSAGDAPTTAAIALQLKSLPFHEQWLATLRQAGARGIEGLPQKAEELSGAEQVLEMMLKQRQVFLADPALLQRVRDSLAQASFPSDEARGRQLLLALAALYDGPEHQYLNFYGPPGTIPTIPFENLIGNEAQEPASDLAGHVVFVGFSDLYDPDQPDRFYTSFTDSHGVDLSGVEIMATAYSNLLAMRPVQPGDAVTVAILVLSFGLATGLVAYLLPATAGVPATVAFAGLYFIFVQWRFNVADLWLPLMVPVLVQLPLALLLGLMGQYLLGRRTQRKFAHAISYYLPENIVKDLTEKEIHPDSVNKVVYGTCLATDMSGFTTLSETKSPKELATFMNEYFDAIAKVLKRHSVDVTEFHADTIMCAWTSPTKSSAVCKKSVLAALEVSEAIDQFAREHGAMRLNPRIGLQDGNFYLGHTGGGGRFQYSILGDTANTAARLESLNKHLGTHILAAASVVEETQGLLLRPVGAIRLAGKADSISVVEIMGVLSKATSDQLALSAEFAIALDLFKGWQWEQAGDRFAELIERFAGDGPSRIYLSLSRKYAVEVPADIDPSIINMDQK